MIDKPTRLTSYTVKVSRKRWQKFDSIPMKRSFWGKWMVSYKEIARCYQAVAREILDDLDDNITLDEMVFLAKVTDTSHEQFSDFVRKYFKERLSDEQEKDVK